MSLSSVRRPSPVVRWWCPAPEAVVEHVNLPAAVGLAMASPARHGMQVDHHADVVLLAQRDNVLQVAEGTRHKALVVQAVIVRSRVSRDRKRKHTKSKLVFQC